MDTRKSLSRKAKCIKNYHQLLTQDGSVVISSRIKQVKWSTSQYFKLDILDQREFCGQHQVLVHYKGWAKKFNEWRCLNEILETPSSAIIPGAKELLQDQLLIRIKEQLNGNRRTDSLVEIKLPIQQQTFEEIKCFLVPGPKNIFYLNKWTDLDAYLGRGWHYRGLNSNGDVCFVVEGSVQVRMYERQPLTEYVSPESSSTLLHRGFQFVFKFVKDNGTRTDFEELLK
ncbi:hypothetical protein HOLleu_02210 [Holothuria leucospilota]|uniref:Chromo domain-containing protein n=1 Tax=Holothuria leucospilota TaxID=206669 RepID=A0A9Q1HJM3_HOLLE|nr:hypothetical protein HOLleu_02210 [Holothuria leucospilota]